MKDVRPNIRNTTFVLLFLVFVAHARWLYVLDISLRRNVIIALLSFMGFILCIGFMNKKDQRLVNELVLPFILLFSIQLIISWLKYEQSFVSTLSASLDYVVIIMLYPLVWVAKDKRSMEKIKNMIIFIGIFVGTILTIQTLILVPKGMELINIQYSQRLGSLRYVNSSEPIMMGALFSLSNLLNQSPKLSKKIMYIISILVACTELFLVSKTKGVLLIFISSIIVMVWLSQTFMKKNILIKKVLLTLFTIIVLNLLLNTKLVGSYYQEYVEAQNSQYDTVSIRINEINHALTTLIKSPIDIIIGTGFISPENSKYSYIVNGTAISNFSRTDIGLMGFIHEFGMLGAIWVLYIIFKATKLLLSFRKIHRIELDFVGFYIVFVLGFGTLFLFNGERLPYFPLFLLFQIFYEKEVSKFKITLQ